ncbi:MAG: ATPase [Selenomonas sp.]|jgi:L-ribulokinase|nr:ATPase [Selenomonas sp.]
MNKEEITAHIKAGDTALGLELGSTNIKAVLVTADCQTVANGSFGWENQLVHGIWTYPLTEAWTGIQACYQQLAEQVQAEYGVPLQKIGSIGVSAMMHGYLAFAADDRQLAQFRTWRNNITAEAAEKLTAAFHFNIPQRWSVAHVYQAALNDEPEVRDIAFLTTLAGYVHWQLSGEKVLGIGDASGMFPIDPSTGTYDAGRLTTFDNLPAVSQLPWKLADILPAVRRAGEEAGTLTPAGAKLLDPSGTLAAGSRMAPPEGDAGTGMVSTNSVRPGTGNISIGTSAFSMNVLDKPLRDVHQDIDIVTTPDGAPVAMVHTNNCTSDLNAWAGLFRDFAEAAGLKLSSAELYGLLLGQVRSAAADAGGLLNYSCLSGENVTRVEAGRPLFVRTPHSRMTLGNFMLSQLYGAFAPLRIGMDILTEEEHISAGSMIAQGGLFKTPQIGQQVLADLLGMPVTIMETADAGGPWGMAVLAAYAALPDADRPSLVDFLAQKVFGQVAGTTCEPTAAGKAGADQFISAYRAGLATERTAGQAIVDADDQ